jgi:magnesium-transporting ATPase (P-type)
MRRVVAGERDLSHCDNQIRNTRYTLLSFVPLLLKEQFSQWLNLYFLGLACLQLVPGLSPTSALATWIPLLCIVAAAGVREALDDLARAKRDRLFNRAHGAIRVGEVVTVREGETVPCDGLLMGEAGTVCYCETQLLDGETDWKEKVGGKEEKKTNA